MQCNEAEIREPKTTFDDAGESNVIYEPIIQVKTMERSETEEERVSVTPQSFDSILYLHKELLFARRDFGYECFDGSVLSDIEGGEILSMVASNQHYNQNEGL